MSNSPPTRSKGDDLAFLCGPTEDRQGARLLRLRHGEIQAGEVRPVQEGVPLNGRELIQLKPRKNASRLCDVEVVHPSDSPIRGHGGPAQVASERYRRNWERIFLSAVEASDRDAASENPTKLPN